MLRLLIATILVSLVAAVPVRVSFNMMNNTVTYGSSCDEGDNCYDLRMQNQPDCTHGWTLHGLWPQWAETCTEEKFDKSQVSSILDRLNSGWPSCQGPADEFWSHEWSKHGTCSGMSQLAYFTKALDLLDQYKSQCDGSNSQSCDVCFTKDLSSTEDCNSRR